MFSKWFKLLSLVTAFVLLVVPSGSAGARPLPPDPSLPPAYPFGYQPPVPRSIPSLTPAAFNPGTGAPPGDQLHLAQAVVQGKPGTVFAYSQTFGETEVPYFADFDHVYNPSGLDFSAAGELYVIEESGARLIKYGTFEDWDTARTPLWSVGQAGLHDWGMTGLNFPHTVTVAPDGASVWVTDNDIISQFDAGTGDLLQRIPPEPWNVPDDNYRFYDARDIAFDTLGNMYLSDMNRQRIMIFTMDTGAPVYATKIEGFTSPAQIVIDTADDSLYVADVFDYTIKHCTPDKTGGWPYPYDCEVFFGVSGEQNKGDDTHLAMAFGLGFNQIHKILYIADGGAGTVFRCTTGPGYSCHALDTGLPSPSDVAVDPVDSTLTVSVYNGNAIYRFYGEDNVPPDKFTGDPRAPWLSNDPGNEPYLTDDLHFNAPAGVEVDALGNIYLVEEQGQRLTKLDKTGVVVWNIGHPGVSSYDDTDYLDYAKSVAIDKRNILVVGGGGSHVRTYNALTGAYMDTLDQGGGDGDYQFGDVFGVATDSANNIYVSDQKNNVVKVYSYNPTSLTQKFTYLRKIGLGGDCGSGNSQFCMPRGIFVDAKKNLYVADNNNCRVQMFDGKGVYKKTFGSGMCRDALSSLHKPNDVAVDAKGSLYVLEEGNPRIQVLDKNGAYLTTIAGNWGADSGALRNPRSLAVDKQATVYVADQNNSRLQKFTAGVPYWTQVNINGFGNRRISAVWTLATFKKVLYAGGVNEYNEAALWKKVGTSWVPVMSDGFDEGGGTGIDHLLEYKGYLYASTLSCTNEDCSSSNGGQLWRSPDGLSWQIVVSEGFRDTNNAELFRMAVLDGKLCVSTWRNDDQGSELWCSPTGDIGTWTQAVDNGFGVNGNKVILSMLDYKSPTGVTASYASTLNQFGYAHVWRKLAGSTTWQPLWNAWPDDGRYFAASAMAAYNGYLYVVVRTQHVDELDDVGATIYRCQKCDGTDWTKTLPEAMSDPASSRGYGLEATPNGLYAFFGNTQKGLDILYSKDGVTWSRPFPYGLGSSNNGITYWDNANLLWGKNIDLGTYNMTNGTGIWKLCPTTKVCK